MIDERLASLGPTVVYRRERAVRALNTLCPDGRRRAARITEQREGGFKGWLNAAGYRVPGFIRQAGEDLVFECRVFPGEEE